MSAKYTPGPWEADYGATKGHIKSLGMPRPEGQDWTPTPTVCRYDVETPSLSEAEKAANGRLIAAAPELLEALEEVLQVNDNLAMFDSELPEEVIKKIQSVIAKARQ